MTKRRFISAIQLYNIKAIRGYRLELSISATELSLGINKGKDYIGTPEKNSSEAYFSDSIMTEIAIFLTEEARKIQAEHDEKKTGEIIKTEYTILDFYPEKPVEDIKVIKYIEPIPYDSGPTGTLNAVIEKSDFFDTPKTLAQTVIHCNEIQNQSWTSSDFTNPLDRLVKIKGRLKIETLEGGIYGYYKLKETK